MDLHIVLTDKLLKRKKEIQIFKEPGGSRYSYQIELGKAFFLHYIVYGDLKYFPRKTASDKVVR